MISSTHPRTPQERGYVSTSKQAALETSAEPAAHSSQCFMVEKLRAALTVVRLSHFYEYIYIPGERGVSH